MKFLTIIGIFLLIGAVGAEPDVSISLIIIQAVIGFTLIAPAYVKILKEEIEDEKCNKHYSKRY